MPNVRVNFSDARDFEAVPAGTYSVVLDDTDVADGPKGLYVKWTFIIETGEYARQRLWMNTSTAAPGIIRTTLRALGEDIDDDVEDFDFDPDDYLGRRVLAQVTQRTYDGRLVNDVKRLLPVSDARNQTGAGIR